MTPMRYARSTSTTSIREACGVGLGTNAARHFSNAVTSGGHEVPDRLHSPLSAQCAAGQC